MQKDILCAFSGGGFRATFFHIGVLRGLIRLGLKNQINMISSVSGGSIINALFGLQYDKIKNLTDFDKMVVEPISNFCMKDDPRNTLLRYRLLGLTRFLGMPQNSEIFMSLLDRYLFNGQTISDLSSNVRVVINSTNLNNGARFRFDNRDFGDYKIGYSYEVDKIPISKAVTASACFPGLFSPLKLDIRKRKFYKRDKQKNDLKSPNFAPDFVYLSDGGLFDNLGYYSIANELSNGRNGFVIISDAANYFSNNNTNYKVLNSSLRIIDIIMEQVCNRDRERIFDKLSSGLWDGLYFKLGNSCRWYREYIHEKCADASKVPDIGWPESIVGRIAGIRTDLNRFSAPEVETLIYHGESLIETVISKWHNSSYKKLIGRPEYISIVKPDSDEQMLYEKLKNSHKHL